MKSDSVFLKANLTLVFCILMLSSVSANNENFPEPKVKAGIAKISGKITGFKLIEGEERPDIILAVPNPVTSTTVAFKATPGDDGSFQFEVPVECSYNIGIIGSEILGGEVISVSLIPDEVTELEIIKDETYGIKACMKSSLEMTSQDMLNHYKMFFKFLGARDEGRLYDMKPDEFSRFAIDSLLVSRLNRTINDSLITEKAKSLITNYCKLFYLKGCLLQYSDYVALKYNNDYMEGKPENFVPQEPDLSYYKLLKEFNLNDPQYLYNDSYPMVLQIILSNETLNIPHINDMPIEDWLRVVKSTMSGLVGFESGLFYDMLVSNAYARQFINELRPLSEKQKENIKSYFSDEEYSKVLFRKNEEIMKLNEEKNRHKPVINETPAVPKEELLNAILSKYKGKAVIIDFWATWCTPCVHAMDEIREVKKAMEGRDIVYVYISGPSSPAEQWEEKAKTVSGEHYYLTRKEWKYLMDSYGFNAIPCYLFFDTSGVLKNKTTGYPGNDKVLQMIRELLPS